MINMDDYRREDGHIDWTAYKEAQVNAGDRCSDCGAYIMFAKGYPDKCCDCKLMEKDEEEVTHNELIRCPYCKNKMNAWDCEFDRLEDGSDETVYCSECDSEFEVGISITYTFKSPEIE